MVKEHADILEIPPEVLEKASEANYNRYMIVAKNKSQWGNCVESSKTVWREATKAAIEAAYAAFRKKPAEELAQEPPKHSQPIVAGNRW